MSHGMIWFVPALCAAPLLGQQAALTHGPAVDVRVSIDTTVTSESQRAVTIDGEEPDFGNRGFGRGRGGGKTTAARQIVFEQAADGSWRRYDELRSVSERPGRDGESARAEVEGALAGKKVRWSKGEAGETVLIAEGEDGAEALPAAYARGARALDLAAVLPGKVVEVGEEFELGSDLRALLLALDHPVVPAREQGGERRGDRGDRGDRGERRGEGRGGRGEGRAGRGEGAGRGGRGFRRGGGSGIEALLANDKLAFSGSGKLVAIEEEGDARRAKIALAAKLEASGDAEQLGLGGGMGFRRGGGDAGTSTAVAAVQWTGHAWFDLVASQVTRIDLAGSWKQSTESKRMVNFDGQEGELETRSSTEGTFEVAVRAEPTR